MQRIHHGRRIVHAPQVACRRARRGAAAVLLLVLSIVLAVQPATAGVSLEKAKVVAVGKGAFSKFLYAGGWRGIVVYERDSSSGKLSFVQSLTGPDQLSEPNQIPPADPSYERCDGNSVDDLADISDIVTTADGWVYTAGNRRSRIGSLQTFRHEAVGLVPKHRRTSANEQQVAYLHLADSILYSIFGQGDGHGGAVQTYAVSTLTNQPTSLLKQVPPPETPGPDLQGPGRTVLLSGEGLLIVPGHTAHKISVLQAPALTQLATLTTASHGIGAPSWVEAYPPASGDFIYVAMDTSVLALRRTGTTFTQIGSPIPVPFSTGRSLVISPDGKHAYLSSHDPGRIMTLVRETSGPDEGKLQPSGLADQVDLPGLSWLTMDAAGSNLYAAVSGSAAAPAPFIATFARNPATGELTDKTLIGNDAESAYSVCTPTLTPTLTLTRTETPTVTETPTRTPTLTPTSHDTRVEARTRLDWKNYPASGPDTADKDRNVSVLNVNLSGASRSISFPTPFTTCPDGVVVGVEPESVTIKPDRRKKVELKLGTVIPGSTTFFDNATKKVPARCYIIVKAENDPAGDRTFWDNTTTVEVDFLTQAEPVPAPPEFVIESSNNRALIKKNQDHVDVGFKLINYDVVARSYEVTGEFAKPESDAFPALPLDPCPLPVPTPVTISVAADDAELGKMRIARQSPPKTAVRCTLILKAMVKPQADTADTESSNNSTRVVIDVEK